MSDVVWYVGAVSREERGHRGATLWFTGLPGSGKSTLAAEVERRLVHGGRPAYLLDGDNLRHGLCKDLGFSPRDRGENVRRVSETARLFADAGLVALVALVSPFAADRLEARESHRREGLAFAEAFMATPPNECERRDPKGQWARARAGELQEFTGVDAPYEPPANPELVIRPDRSVDDAAEEVLRWILH